MTNDEHHDDRSVTEMDELLTANELAEALGVSVDTLERWRKNSEIGPPYVKLSPRTIRYPVRHVNDWLSDNLQAA